mgnify:CR=1 FL=1
MATNPKSEPPQTDSLKTDDLTTIVGINETLEQWLRETLKVQTFADLAALSVQKIKSRGKQAGHVFSNEELELMLTQAKKLADAQSSSLSQSGQPTKIKPETSPAASPKTKEWNQFATFIVCFERKIADGKEEKRTKIEHRTGIEHHDTGETNTWPGIVTAEACQWMLQRLGYEINPVSEKAPGHDATPKENASDLIERPLPQSVALEVVGVQVFQPSSSTQPQNLFMQNQVFTGFVRSGEPLSFAATFKLTGDEIDKVTQRNAEFNVTFNAQDLFTSVISQLGISRPDFLTENQFTYTAWLTDLALPKGVYSLRLVISVRDLKPLWATIEVPVLQVV